MPYKSTHHISGFAHGCKHSGVHLSVAFFLITASYQLVVFLSLHHRVLNQRDMEKSKSRVRHSGILLSVCCTLCSIPLYLIECKPVISTNLFDRCISSRIEKVKNRLYLIFRSSLHLEDIVSYSVQRLVSCLSKTVWFDGYEIHEFLTRRFVFVIMVSEHIGPRYLPFYHKVEDIIKPFFYRLRINDITCEYN